MKFCSCENKENNFDKAYQELVDFLKKSNKECEIKGDNWPENFKKLEKYSANFLLKFHSRENLLKKDNLHFYADMAKKISEAKISDASAIHSLSIKVATYWIAGATCIQAIIMLTQLINKYF